MAISFPDDGLDYATWGDPVSIDSSLGITVSFWMRRDAQIPGTRTILSFYEGTETERMVLWANPDFNFRVGFPLTGGNKAAAYDAGPALDAWVHIFYTDDGSAFSAGVDLYFDNVLQSIESVPETADGSGVAYVLDGTIQFGAEAANRSLGFSIGNVGIWEGQLSADDRARLASGESPINVATAGLKFAPPMVENLTDPVSGVSGTKNGTTVSAHPRTVEPYLEQVVGPQAAEIMEPAIGPQWAENLWRYAAWSDAWRTADEVAEEEVTTLPGGGRGAKRRYLKRYPRRVVIDGRTYWVGSPAEERQLLAEYLDKLETQALTVALEERPAEEVKRARVKVVRAAKRVAAVDNREDQWLEYLREEDEIILAALWD